VSNADEVLKLFDPERRRKNKSKAYVAGLSAASAGSAGVSLKKLKGSSENAQMHTFASKPQMIKIKTKPSNPKAAAAYGAGALVAATSAGLIARHAKRGGKTYTNKYE